MSYIIIFIAIAYILYKVYQMAMLHDARFAVVDEKKNQKHDCRFTCQYWQRKL